MKLGGYVEKSVWYCIMKLEFDSLSSNTVMHNVIFVCILETGQFLKWSA